MLAFGGGVAAVLVVGGGIYWGLSRAGGPRSVPVIEPDPRPFKVRPDDPGGLRVPNQDELIFERNRGSSLQPRDARLAPEPEAPSLEALRAQVAQPAPRAAAPEPPAATAAPPTGAAPRVAATTQPPAAASRAGAPATPAPVSAPAAEQPAAPTSFTPAANGRIRVQLGALTSEESARGEWDRLARAHADLLGAFRPQVVRFERDGQATLYRLRTGGFADAATAQAFCEQAKAKRMPCVVVR